MSRKLLATGVALLALAAAFGAEAARHVTPTVTTIAQWKGTLAGLAQDQQSIAWCAGDAKGTQTIHLRRLPSGAGRTFPAVAGDRGYCDAFSTTVATARGSVAWGGYEEVRCSDTHWSIYAAQPKGPRTVETAAPGCLAYGLNFIGLVSDGTSLLLATVRYEGDSDACEIDDRCVYDVSGGGVFRITDGRPVRLAHVDPPGKIAAGAGRVALAQPAAGGPYSAQSGAIPVPGPAARGLITIKQTSTGALVSHVRALGDVTALALTQNYLVVLDGVQFDWYDVQTGGHRGTTAGAIGTSPTIAAWGSRVVYVAGDELRLLDLETKNDTILWRGKAPPLWPSIVGSRVIWGVNGTNARILSTTVG